METVILLIHLMIAIALVISVMLQQTEGGALGIGGGSNSFMAGRSSADTMTKVTIYLAAAFFLTSIILTVLAQRPKAGLSVPDKIKVEKTTKPSVPLKTDKPSTPSAPISK